MAYLSIPGDLFRPAWLSTTRGYKRAKSQYLENKEEAKHTNGEIGVVTSFVVIIV